MKILLVAGARPNFMKVAPILHAARVENIDVCLVHTGQHYDANMSDTFFTDLDIPEPDYHLEVGSGTHAVQTARVMEAFEPVLREVRPSWVVVVGDVNSTLACALVACKLKEELGCRVAHVEAGLRSNDWRMPEEVNRVVTDRISDLLLTPSTDALPKLIAEGIPEDRVRFVGNVMIDTLTAQLPQARALNLPKELGLVSGEYAVVTLHRPSNVDSVDTLRAVLEALAKLAETRPVVFPVHPRTAKNAREFGLDELLAPLQSIDPVGYHGMLSLMADAGVVVTDSGGVQEETTVLRVPCVTLREQTERPITISQGTNRLAPWPLTADGILRSVSEALVSRGNNQEIPEGWDGHAAVRIVRELQA